MARLRHHPRPRSGEFQVVRNNHESLNERAERSLLTRAPLTLLGPPNQLGDRLETHGEKVAAKVRLVSSAIGRFPFTRMQEARNACVEKDDRHQVSFRALDRITTRASFRSD